MVQEGVQKLEGSFQRLEGSVATVKEGLGKLRVGIAGLKGDIKRYGTIFTFFAGLASVAGVVIAALMYFRQVS